MRMCLVIPCLTSPRNYHECAAHPFRSDAPRPVSRFRTVTAVSAADSFLLHTASSPILQGALKGGTAHSSCLRGALSQARHHSVLSSAVRSIARKLMRYDFAT